MTNASMVVPTRRVEMWYAGTAAQNRLTVAFRIILAIPQFIILYHPLHRVLLRAVIGWFAALFTGRLPAWAHTFLARRYPLVRVGRRICVPADRPLPALLPRRRGVPGATGPARPGSAQPRVRLLPHHPGHPGGRLLRDRAERPDVPVALLRVDRRPGPRQHARRAVRRVRGAAALPGPFPLVVLDADLRVCVGNAGRLRPVAPGGPHGATPRGVPGPAGSGTPCGTQPPAARPPRPPPGQPSAYPATPGDQVATPRRPRGRPPAPPGWPPPQPAPPTAAPAPMPPPSQRERTSIPSAPDPLPPWGILVLQGAARAWMIFAIVWGSILFVGQNVARGIGNNNNANNHSMFVQLNSVHPDPPGLTHVIGQVPTDL